MPDCFLLQVLRMMGRVVELWCMVLYMFPINLLYCHHSQDTTVIDDMLRDVVTNVLESFLYVLRCFTLQCRNVSSSLPGMPV